MPGYPGRRQYTLEEVIKDRTLLYKMSAQEQVEFLKALKTIRTPAANLSGMAQYVDPFKFFREVLGWLPTEVAKVYGYTEGISPDQIEVVKSVVKNKFTAAPAGHAVGKTKIAAGIALWFLYAFGPKSKVITTAPTWRQVEELLWAQIRASFGSAKIPLTGECLTAKIKTGYPEWYAIGISTRPERQDMNATSFAGFHAPYVLVIIDEATGVPAEIWNAVDGIIIGENDRVLAIGNPTDPTAVFKEKCDSGRYNVVRIDCRRHPNVIHDNPNIIPGAVTKGWVEERAEDYEGEDTPLFRARVSGEWPDESANTVITLAVLAKAQELYLELLEKEAQEIEDWKGNCIGLDVAREGADLTVMTCCRNGMVMPQWWHTGKDTTATVDRVIGWVHLHGARMIALDDTGVGGGVTDQLRKAQKEGKLPEGSDFKIVPVNFATNAMDEKQYNRIKDQMWWELAKDMKEGRVALPTEEMLRAVMKTPFPRHSKMSTQLVKPLYVLDTRARIDVLDKRDPNDERTASLPAKSPDIAHSIILARWAWALAGRMRQENPAKSTEEMMKREFAGWAREKVAAFRKNFERKQQGGGFDNDGVLR